jgi:hypothetical protein
MKITPPFTVEKQQIIVKTPRYIFKISSPNNKDILITDKKECDRYKQTDKRSSSP